MIHGEGSDISLKISLLYGSYNLKDNTNIDIIAIYDQGSSKTHLQPIVPISVILNQFWDTYFSGGLNNISYFIFNILCNSNLLFCNNEILYIWTINQIKKSIFYGAKINNS
ncbi:MAG: hypothetical protein WCB31_00640 [Nitrososphaeraceae archaeon]